MDIQRNPALIGEAEHISMNISEVAYAMLDPDWACANARAAITRVYFVVQGEGEVRSGETCLRLLPGNIYLIPSGMPFSYSCAAHLEKLYCHINLLRYRHEDLFAGCHQFICLSDRAAEIEEALTCFRAEDASQAMHLRALLYRIAWEGLCMAGVNWQGLKEYSPLVRGAISYVEKNLHVGLSAAAVASALYVSESRLQKHFRREVGQPLGRYIADSILAVAERELRLTARPVGEISDALGFCDRFYFTRLFTARYGLPPAKYRRNVAL